MPELRHLQHFVAAAEELNFTRAAARLHVVQQSLSATIKQLERELGVRLFDRTTRVVRLTAAGQDFLPAARHVLTEAEHAFASARVQAEIRPELSVGFSFAIDDQARYQFLERFIGEHPSARLSIQTAASGELLDLVESGDLDLAVTFCPVERHGIEMATVMQVRVWVQLSEAHRLGRLESIELADLRDEVFLLAAEPGGAGFNEWLLATCRDAGFVPKMSYRSAAAMNIRINDLPPDAVTLAVWQPLVGAHGSTLRPLRPETTAPYVAAVRAGADGAPRHAFDSVVAAGPMVAEFMRKREMTALESRSILQPMIDKSDLSTPRQSLFLGVIGEV